MAGLNCPRAWLVMATALADPLVVLDRDGGYEPYPDGREGLPQDGGDEAHRRSTPACRTTTTD